MSGFDLPIIRHHRLQSLLEYPRPTVFKCITVLKSEQKRNESVIARLYAGENPPPPKKKYKVIDDRIQRIVRGYNGQNIERYLHGLAHNY